MERDNAVDDTDNFFGVKQEARQAAQEAEIYVALLKKASALCLTVRLGDTVT